MHKFFDTLYGEELKYDIALWTLPDKKTKCLPIRAIQDFVKNNINSKDIYYHVGLSKKQIKNGRYRAIDIQAIPGFWLDIDIANNGEKKPRFKSFEHFQIFLERNKLPEPTIYVSSGYGLHVYWVFNELLEFTPGKSAKGVAEKLAKWNLLIKHLANKEGIVVDSVFDLSRVLRVPGTINYKNNEQNPVYVIINNTSIRYDISDFDIYTSGIDVDVNLEKSIIAMKFILDANAVPPFEKFDILASNDPDFNATWEGNRPDLKDGSASSYDMALTIRAARAGWTDQELANLLIARRRKAGDELKLRERYYDLTILKAKEFIKEEQARNRIEDFALSPGPLEAQEDKDTICQELSILFKINVKRIIKYTSDESADEPIYLLVTDRGSINLGTVKYLIGQGHFRQKVAAAAGACIRNFKSNTWDSIRQTLLDACTIVDIGDNTTERQFASYLLEYIKDNPPADTLDDDIAENNLPYKTKDILYIFALGFKNYTYRIYRERYTVQQVGKLLRQAGATYEKINIKLDNKWTTEGVWNVSGFINQE